MSCRVLEKLEEECWDRKVTWNIGSPEAVESGDTKRGAKTGDSGSHWKGLVKSELILSRGGGNNHTLIMSNVWHFLPLHLPFSHLMILGISAL